MEKPIVGGDIDKGTGFVLGEETNGSRDLYQPSVTFQEGQSSDVNKQKLAEEREIEERRIDNLSKADFAYEELGRMLIGRSSYSETFIINSDGSFDKTRLDGMPAYISGAKTPQEFYILAKQVQEKHTDYHFEFDTNSEGKTFKYTVTKVN